LANLTRVVSRQVAETRTKRQTVMAFILLSN